MFLNGIEALCHHVRGSLLCPMSTINHCALLIACRTPLPYTRGGHYTASHYDVVLPSYPAQTHQYLEITHGIGGRIDHLPIYAPRSLLRHITHSREQTDTKYHQPAVDGVGRIYIIS